MIKRAHRIHDWPFPTQLLTSANYECQPYKDMTEGSTFHLRDSKGISILEEIMGVVLQVLRLRFLAVMAVYLIWRNFHHCLT